MFRTHTAQFGSCASEIHKTLCYFFAGVNIFLAIELLAEFSDELWDFFDDRIILDDDDGYEDSEATLHTVALAAFGFIAGPATANIILGILLIFGVYKRRPLLIRIFRIFILAQIAIIVVLSFFSYRVVLEHESSYIIMLLVLAISIALFGAEAWIAGDYYELLVEEIRLENLNTIRFM